MSQESIRAIAQQIRRLANQRDSFYAEKSAGRLLTDAIELGAFAGDEFAHFRLVCEPARYADPPLPDRWIGRDGVPRKYNLQFVRVFRAAIGWLRTNQVGISAIEGIEFSTSTEDNLLALADVLERDSERGGANKFAYLDELDCIEKETPPLDKHNGEWLKASDVAIFDVVDIDSLNTMRRQGKANLGLTFGIDKTGRKWRKESKESKTVWYYKHSLRKSVQSVQT